MGLLSLFQQKDDFLAVDIGSSGLKLVQLDTSGSRPTLVNLAFEPFTQEIYSNYAINHPEIVTEKLTKALESAGFSTKLALTAVPGPSVFTKRIKMQMLDREELARNIQMEAANFIPHNIDAVKLDYHVLGESGKNQLEILVVAVKTEIIETFLESLLGAGLETMVVDVDTFALQNTFELGYAQEMKGKTVALVNIGARYSSVNICKNETSLFIGDVGIGGKSVTEAMAADLGMPMREVEELKRKGEAAPENVKAAMKKQVEHMAAELNRQLAFFWNASGAEEGIDQIVVSGGGSKLTGLIQALALKTGINTIPLDPFKGIQVANSVDSVLVKDLAAYMGIAVGIALREPGDKIFPGGM